MKKTKKAVIKARIENAFFARTYNAKHFIMASLIIAFAEIIVYYVFGYYENTVSKMFLLLGIASLVMNLMGVVRHE